MFHAELPFVAIDPVGSWWGLRSGRDGARGGGLPIVIFGGEHGDIPLERASGEYIADLVVEKRLSCVLDVSNFPTEADKKKFLLDFARRLYGMNRDPMHLFLEEADDYIPQKPMGDETHLLRAWENIVRRGRARGIGITLITQRSAAVNKMVLTQVETLFALRTTGPQDIKAIGEWVKYNRVDEKLLASLASLSDGDAWVWSPSYLHKIQRIHFRQRSTFHACPLDTTESMAIVPISAVGTGRVEGMDMGIKLGKKLPSAREVRDVHGHVDIGAYRVSRNPWDQQQNMRFLWRVLGPEKTSGVEKGLRDVLDEHATYREAVADARKREEQDRVNRMLQHSKLGHFGPKVLDALDAAIEHLLDIYNGEQVTIENTQPLLFDLIATSRRARGLGPLQTLPEEWRDEVRDAVGS